MRKSLLLCLFVSLCTLVSAQVPSEDLQEKGGLSEEEIAQLEADRWRKNKSEADGLFRTAQYEKAAREYERAWLKKPLKYELAYLSGRCYLIVKDYRKAADMLRVVKDDFRRFPKAALSYAQALKQDEQYEEAIEEFERFMNRYTGSDAAELLAEVNMDIEGCKLGRKFKNDLVNSTTKVRHLGSVVNTPKTEFAPAPFGTDELLFSSTKAGGARIFSTIRTHRGWDMPTEAKQFANFKAENICNATLSPDEKRMYFTVCKAEETWGELTTLCQIYVTKRMGNLWSNAEKLPETINMQGYTTTQPNVVHAGGMEILYFSSNRPYGQGGMDIWYAVRDLGSSDLEYSNPKNVGARINTPVNEITPFYDMNEKVLFFSSNGHPSAGGLDVFSAKGEKSTWDRPQNIGFPYNSGADDFCFIKNRYRNDGFVVSNRMLGSEKQSTAHEDIFEFRERSGQVFVIKGSIFNQDTNERMPNVEMSVYEVTGAGVEKFVKTAKFSEGRYSIQLEPNKKYKIIADKKSYQPKIWTFTAGEHGTTTEHFYLSIFNKEDMIETPRPILPGQDMPPISPPETANVKAYTAPEPVVTRPSTQKNTSYNEVERAKYIYTPSNPKERTRIETNAPKHLQVYYKVQLSAVKDFNSIAHEFERLKQLGRIDTEVLLDRGLTRVLLADFFDKTDALEALKSVKRSGYSSAFLVRYENGERGGSTK